MSADAEPAKSSTWAQQPAHCRAPQLSRQRQQTVLLQGSGEVCKQGGGGGRGALRTSELKQVRRALEAKGLEDAGRLTASPPSMIAKSHRSPSLF